MTGSFSVTNDYRFMGIAAPPLRFTGPEYTGAAGAGGAGTAGAGVGKAETVDAGSGAAGTAGAGADCVVLLFACPSSVKTCRVLIAQKASLKACGLFVTYSLQVGAREAQLEEVHVSPAHYLKISNVCLHLGEGVVTAPQKVVSKTSERSRKLLSKLKSPWKTERGVPQSAFGCGLLLATSAGMDPRGKNQILTKSLVHSVANTPPPTPLKPVPKLRSESSPIEQPAFLNWSGALTSQLLVMTLPLKESAAALRTGPAEEWRVIKFLV